MYANVPFDINDMRSMHRKKEDIVQAKLGIIKLDDNEKCIVKTWETIDLKYTPEFAIKALLEKNLEKIDDMAQKFKKQPVYKIFQCTQSDQIDTY